MGVNRMSGNSAKPTHHLLLSMLSVARHFSHVGDFSLRTPEDLDEVLAMYNWAFLIKFYFNALEFLARKLFKIALLYALN